MSLSAVAALILGVLAADHVNNPLRIFGEDPRVYPGLVFAPARSLLNATDMEVIRVRKTRRFVYAAGRRPGQVGALIFRVADEGEQKVETIAVESDRVT